MDEKELAQTAIQMQRDYTNPEIAQLLGVRLEDLNTAIDHFKRGITETTPPETRPKRKRKSSSQQE